MTIQSATQAAAKQQAGNASRTVEQQKNFMLKLLAVQMENQNPLKPMDSSKVGQQLAAFASVEQQQMTNSLLKTLITSVQGMSSSSPQSFIGKTAQVKSDTALLDGDGFGKWTYTPPAGTKSVSLKITDEKGNELLKKPVDNISAGENRVKWKGPVDANGKPLTGKFKLSVVAYDAQGVVSKVTNINSIGKITKAVVDEKGGIHFRINDQLFPKSTIKYIG